jgi:DHA1 family tetracycline resistance protein-like MFS transporter
MQFLFAPLLGALSDTYGRKPVLIWALAIMVIDYAVMGLTHSLVMLLIARLLGGMASATHSTAFAAMADLSPKEKRATGFGLIGASFGLGFVLGPTIGGVLGEFGTRAPFWMAAGLAAFNVIFGLLAFPETSSMRPGMTGRIRPMPIASIITVINRNTTGRRPLGLVGRDTKSGSFLRIAVRYAFICSVTALAKARASVGALPMAEVGSNIAGSSSG